MSYLTILILSLLCLSVSAISNCPANSINCQVCPNNARSNDIAGIPRLNKNGAMTPASIGAYTMVDCTSDGSSCVGYQDNAYGTKSNPAAKQQSLFDRITGSPTSDQDPVQYVWSLIVHVIIALILVLLTILCGCGLLIGRYCCCCIKGGTCGKRWPTLRTRYIGFLQNNQTGEYEYPVKEKWVVRVYMWIFVFCIFLFIGLGYFQGTQKIAPSMKSVANSPAPIYSTLQSTATPIANAIVRITSETLPQTVHNINNTINGIVNLADLAGNVQCIVGIIPKLPNVVYLSNNITAIGSSIDNIQQTFNTEVPSYQSSLQGVLNNVTNDVNTLSLRLTDISNNLTATSNDLALTSGAVSDIDTFVATEINNPVDGIPATANDVSKMQNMPSSDEANTASGGLTTLPTTQSTAQTLISQLNDIDTRFKNTPNLTVTAQHMDKFNQRLASPYRVRVINAVYNNLTATQTQIGGIYTAINGVNDALNHLTNVTLLYANMTFDSARASILRINTSIEAVPSLTVISNELGKVQATRNQVLPCAYNLTNQIIAVNAQLVKLPNYILNVSSHTTDLQNGLDTAIAKVNDTQAQLANMERSRTQDINLQDFLNQITTLQNTMLNETNTLINGPYVQELHTVSNDTVLNYTVSNQVILFNTTMNNASISQTTINNTKNVEIAKENIYTGNANITRIIQDLTTWANTGVCVIKATAGNPTGTTSSTTCTTDTTCTTALGAQYTCSIMNPRCSIQQAISCAQDTNCNSTNPIDYCLVDSVRRGALALFLQGYALGRPSDTQLAATATSLNATSTTSQLGTQELKNGIATAQNSVNQVNPASFQSTITSVKQHLSTDINLNSQQSQINTLNNTISGLKGTLAGSQAQINQLNNTYATVRSQLADMNTATNVITFVQNTLVVKINQILENLNEDNMNLYRFQDNQLNNIGAMIGYIAQQFDEFTTYWNNGQNVYYINNGTNYYNKTSTIRDYSSRLTNTQDVQYGAVYALGRLFQKSITIEATLTSDGDMIFENAQQQSYSDFSNTDRYGGATKCLTNKCIDATIDFYTGSSIKTLFAKSGVTTSVNLNLSPIQFLGLPLLFCFVCGLLGLISSTMYHSYKWASWCSSITLCWIWVLMPIMFLLSAFTFPIVLFTGDACMGIEDVANQYLLGRQNFACTSDAQGHGTATQCFIDIDGQTLQSEINIPALYSSIVGNGCSGGNDPVGNILESMRAQLEAYPTNQVISFLNSTNQIQPILRNTIINSTKDAILIQTIDATLTDFKSTVGCSALSSSYKSAKSGLCCDAATAIYWSIATWYLIAWSMLFCGCGAALLGRKRFGRGLWGDDHDLLTQPDMVKYDGDPLSIQPSEANGGLMVVATVVTATHAIESPSVEMLSPPPYAALHSPSPNAAVHPSPINEGIEGRRASISSVDSEVGPVAGGTTDAIEMAPASAPDAPGGYSDNFQSEHKPSPISHSRNPSSSPANRYSEPLVPNEYKQEEPTVVMISE